MLALAPRVLKHEGMAGSGPGEHGLVGAQSKLRSGDRVKLKVVDEELRLSGLTPDVVGVVDMELAVGGFLVGFPGGALLVFGEDDLVRAE